MLNGGLTTMVNIWLQETAAPFGHLGGSHRSGADIMNPISRILLAAAATAAIASTPALAADYDPPIVVDKAPEFVPVEVGNGWYLRGDLGYSFGAEANGQANYRVFQSIGIDDCRHLQSTPCTLYRKTK